MLKLLKWILICIAAIIVAYTVLQVKDCRETSPSVAAQSSSKNFEGVIFIEYNEIEE